MNLVQGLVTTFTEIAVPQVEAAMFKIMPDLSLEDDVSEDKSNAQGLFTLGFGTTEYDRMIMLSKEGKPLGGMNTADFVTLQRHINGVEPITEPYKLYAADLDGNGRVGANDLLLLRNALLGGYQFSGYKGNLSWIFFGDPCDPTSMDDLVNGYCHAGVEVSQNGTFPATVEFKAIKMGDVNADLTNLGWNISTRTASTMEIQVRENTLDGSLDFILGQDETVFGLQMSFDAQDLTLTAGVVPVSANNIATDKQGITRLSWGQANGMNLKAGEVLFTIHNLPLDQELNKLLVINEEALVPEIYTDLKAGRKISLVPFAQASAEAGFETKVSPNPFNETAILEVTIPAGEKFTVTFYDIKGQEISSRDYVSYADKAEVVIGKDVISAPGIYYYRVKSTIGELSGKFVRQ
jgi:hypothetical protein